MSRTDETRVQKVLSANQDYKAGVDLEEYLAVAEAHVDGIAAKAVTDGVSVSDSLLATIETWLAAWAYCQSDQPMREKWTEKAKAMYQGVTGRGFESNKYGQTALTLDPTGYLAAASEGNKRVRVGVRWLGTAESEQTSYEERNFSPEG